MDKSDKILNIITHVKKMLFNYFMSEVIVICITLVETLIAYSILGVNYIIILSLITAICDFLPIVGIAIIYFPAAFIYMLMGNYFTAIGLVIAYTIISIIRQIIEPKIVSSTMGIHPVAALAALFIGLQAGGVMGIIFCMFYVLIFNMLKNIEIL